MNTREAGKQQAEEFVTKVVGSMKQDGGVYRLRWWPEIPSDPEGPGSATDTTMPLRVYRGDSWRSIGFTGTDIDRSVGNPESLRKYEGDVIETLADL